MSFLQVLLLGVLQGATEFLPVSSSGHLVIIPYLLNWPDPGLALDTVLHLGTLVAVLIYFRRDLARLARAAWTSLEQRSLDDAEARLAWALVWGTVPAVLLGLLLEDWITRLFAMPRVTGGFLLVTAALLWISERVSSSQYILEALDWRDALLIGVGQSLAIAPGISRSGATIAAGLLLGYRRDEATRFSFLLSVPIILGSGLYQILKSVGGGFNGTPPLVLVGGFLAAAVTGYAAIWGLLALVRRQSLWPFAAYCATLGLLVLTGVLS